MKESILLFLYTKMREKNEQKHQYLEKEVDFTGQCFFFSKSAVMMIFAISDQICVVLYQFFAFIAKRYIFVPEWLFCFAIKIFAFDFFFTK